MENVALKSIIFTSVSCDIDAENAKKFNVQVANQMMLNVHSDTKDNRFMLAFETTVTEPKTNCVSIKVKANVFFEWKVKPSSYDDLVKESFPIAFKEIADKIDQMLEVLNYPKLNLGEAIKV